MKINGNEELLARLTTGQTGKSGKPVKGVFNALLRETAKSENTGIGESHSIQGPGSIRGVSFNPLFDAAPASISERIENFLNLLESYRDMLADPAVSLKDIDPVMRKLSSEKSNLQKIQGSLPAEDAALREILNQVLVAASLEEIKFNKGDYNPL